MLSYLSEEDRQKVIELNKSAQTTLDVGFVGIRSKCLDILYLIKIIHNLNEEIHDMYCK